MPGTGIEFIMLTIKNALSNFFVLITLASFVVSTTGFASYTHSCKHHESEQPVLIDESSCCSTEKADIENVEKNCCPSHQCVTNDEYSNCCSDEMHYYRLAEWYTPTDGEKSKLVCKTIEVKSNSRICHEDNRDSDKESELNESQELIPKLPKYRLYNQVKIDPPLISFNFIFNQTH